jgi:hypothetical protein
MGGGVVQGQGTLHRHIVEVAQHGLGVGHGCIGSGQENQRIKGFALAKIMPMESKPFNRP